MNNHYHPHHLPSSSSSSIDQLIQLTSHLQTDEEDQRNTVFDQGYHTLMLSPPPLGQWYHHYHHRRPRHDHFTPLPDTVLLHIFTYLSAIDLSRCAQVSRRFNTIIWTTSKLWRNVRLTPTTIPNPERAIRTMYKQLKCGVIQRLYLTVELSEKTWRILTILTTNKLTHLVVHGVSNVSNDIICDILRVNQTFIQHIDVAGCQNVTCPFIDGTLTFLQLSTLDLTDCIHLQDNDLNTIIKQCPQLQYLYLRRCVHLTDNSVRNVPMFCPDVRELSLSDCWQVTDYSLWELGTLTTNLRYLSVAKCRQVSDVGVKHVVRRCYKLRYLNVRGCEAISDDAICWLARSCSVRLMALDIGRCDVTDLGLRTLAEHCPNLKRLGMRACDLITDLGVQTVAYCCRSLQQLNIQDCPVTVDGYRAVKRYCKKCIIEHTNPGFC